MDALILGAPEIQAQAVAAAARMPVHIEFARGLIFVAFVILLMTVLLELAMPEQGPHP